MIKILKIKNKIQIILSVPIKQTNKMSLVTKTTISKYNKSTRNIVNRMIKTKMVI
jgi:hypothetical protein